MDPFKHKGDPFRFRQHLTYIAYEGDVNDFR